MTLSMYQAAVPVFIRTLGNLRHVLGKGQAHAQAKGVSDAVLLETRLIPDMHPLRRQVQIATDMVTRGAARLAGLEPPSVPDEEATFEQLYTRLDRTVDYLKSFTPEQIDGSERRAIHLKMRGSELDLEGEAYLLHFVIPNLFFHCTTAYAILRQSGAELGKSDFLGPA
ncbi:DUF1993 domain-containing protein [Frateuria defendens]|uniref:DUF1993 domain-containing protein n=1 Tax=Frateuria defendens TaxID=2219559 RepID=UPI00066FFD87|nr:DUF1993 domain-containing protein [Frateuria defendens]